MVRALNLSEVKTRALAGALEKIKAPKALLVDQGENRNLRLSARNLADANFIDVKGVNVYDILRRDQLVLTKAAVEALEERLK